jgi:hypothetical protein
MSCQFPPKKGALVSKVLDTKMYCGLPDYIAQTGLACLAYDSKVHCWKFFKM